MPDSAPVASPVSLETSEAGPEAMHKRNQLVIRLLLISAFVVILNETIMGVALPHLMKDLGISASSAQWLTTAFMLTMAVVIPITGYLLQRFHTRSIFIAAMTLFSTGTLIAAVSPGFEMLLAGRIVQASGTAIMMPLLFTTVMNLIPPATRGRTMGNISIVISVAPAIGPTISGLILSVLDWRWMFILVLPVAVGALLLGAARVQNVTTPRASRFDVPSVILSAFGFGGVVYGLSNLSLGFVPLAIGVVALAAFVARQIVLQKRDEALLDLRTFTSRTFAFAIVMIAISMIALFGTIILLPIYMQNVLGLATVTTGLLMLPGGLIMGLMAPTVGRVYDRVGPTALVVTGSTIVSSVLWSITMLDENSSFWWVLVAHVVLSIGLALLFTPLFTAGLASLPQSLYSHGSAIVGTVQQLAGAVGIALFVTVMSAQSATLISGGAAEVAATADGIQLAFLFGAVISLFAIPAAFFVRRPSGAHNPEVGHEAGLLAAEGEHAAV